MGALDPVFATGSSVPGAIRTLLVDSGRRERRAVAELIERFVSGD